MICTELSGKEPYRQIGVDWMIVSRRLSGVVISMLPKGGKKAGFDPALGAVFPISSPTHHCFHITCIS